MGERYWLWLGARLVAAVVLVLWAASYIAGPSSGDKEFKKTLEAMKQVKSFRAVYVADPRATQHTDVLWEVDCNRGIVHHLYRDVESNTDPPTEVKTEEIMVGGRKYARNSDGSWGAGYASQTGSSTWYCTNLTLGTDTNLLPDVAKLLRSAIIDKGDKKTVNGVECREWNITQKLGLFLRHGSVCIGTQDHLPYEMSSVDTGTHYSYSDYNANIPFELPEAALQQASASSGTQ